MKSPPFGEQIRNELPDRGKGRGLGSPMADLSFPPLSSRRQHLKNYSAVETLHFIHEDAEGQRNTVTPLGSHLFQWQIWEVNQGLQSIA